LIFAIWSICAKKYPSFSTRALVTFSSAPLIFSLTAAQKKHCCAKNWQAEEKNQQEHSSISQPLSSTHPLMPLCLFLPIVNLE
jgi:hypothetical protein